MNQVCVPGRFSIASGKNASASVHGTALPVRFSDEVDPM